MIVQLGGQTPLGLADRLTAPGVPIVGTPPAAIDLAEDRGAFGEVLREAGLPAPAFGTATSFEQARRSPTASATRCSSGPRTCSAGAAWRSSTTTRRSPATSRGPPTISPDRPVLVDRFLDDAVEIDVDALCDGDELFIGGVMEHIEEAGCTPATRRARCRRSRSGLGARPGAPLHRGDRARRRRARPAQRAVRAARRRALRAGGQPAGVAHRAVRVEGDGGAAGQGGRADHARRDRSPSCARRGCCRPTATAASCRPTRRSR